MAITETQTKPIEEKKAEPLFWVVPTYHGWLEEKQFVLEFELPGVKKDEIKIKALPDEFLLEAKRERYGYHADLDLTFEIDPTKIKATYHEGLLRVEISLVDPTEKAVEVKIE